MPSLFIVVEFKKWWLCLKNGGCVVADRSPPRLSYFPRHRHRNNIKKPSHISVEGSLFF